MTSIACLRSLGASVFIALVGTGCTEPEPEPADFDRVQEIFDIHGCADATCHSRVAAEAQLILDAPEAYDQLVGEPCANPEADDTGWLRVAPGDLENSFLWIKLTQDAYDPRYGYPMPIVGGRLTNDELDII